ncbi:MAG: hypothetical protein QG657_1470, partial [Acidobacteriota bacterium]|nr:hypothetical protein [Acidobacteriota bacterium]
MSIAQLLTKLEELNIYIDVIDDTLKVQAPDGKLTTALIKELKEKKQDIIDFFQKNDQERKYISIPPAAEKAYYELSSAQMRMYFLQQMNLNNTVYNITQFIKLGALKGADNREEPGIDVKKLEDTFKRLIERHESLRTSFRMVKGRPTQKIHKEVDFKIEFFNKVADFVRTFDLTQAPLIRIGIIEAGPEDRLLGIDMHHIICDGVSYKILVRDFYSLYRNESQLPPLRIHYKDYTEWQNSQKQKEAIKKQETYWLKEFPGEIPIIDIPTDFPRPAIQSFEGRKLFYEITGETALMLTNMALENGTTLYIILLSILNILWSKLSSQEDIIMGTPTAGRLHADLENIIGMFVNTLTLRNYPGKEKTFKAFLHEVNQRTIEAFENQDYPFEDLVEKLAVKRDASRNPMFDLMFAWQDINSNVKSEISHYSKPLSRFDLTWGGMGNKYHLFFDIEYCTKLFEEDTILRFIEFFKRITSSIIECSDRKIAQIEIITEEEKNRILYDFNDSEMT